jgi:AcrR family transcriptional regulator
LNTVMDFRDNWLAHFKAIVHAAIESERGDERAGYREVARRLEMNEETVYQFYKSKSGKKYPGAPTIIQLERVYGKGLPPGWASQPVGNKLTSPSTQPTLRESLAAFHTAVQRVSASRRQELFDLLRLYLREPTRYSHLIADIETALSGEQGSSHSEPASGSR